MVPSGDQTACDAPVESVVNCRGSPPVGLMSQIWLSPDREDSNAISEPSGDQTGFRSEAACVVSCRWTLPSTEETQISELFLLAFTSGVVSVYATHLPSGESAGAAIRFMVPMSSMVTGRFACAFSGNARTQTARA